MRFLAWTLSERQNEAMRRFAFSGLVCAVLVACGGAGSTDLFGGDSDGGGGSSGDGSSAADGSGGGGNEDDGGGGGSNQDGSGGGKVDSGSVKDAGNSRPCTVGSGGTSNTCAGDEVCVSPNCTTGSCQKIAVGASDYSPVCGCDTVNYWNAATASSFVAAVKSAGACASPALCNGAPAGNAKCNALAAADCAFDRPDVGGTTCGATLKNPSCWGMPTTCPKPTTGVNVCTGGACTDLCSAIKNQTPYRLATPACKIM